MENNLSHSLVFYVGFRRVGWGEVILPGAGFLFVNNRQGYLNSLSFQGKNLTN
jgi:hypothetical protein